MNFIWLDINASWSHSSLALPALHANLSPQTQAACNMQVVRGTIKSPVQQIVQELEQLQPTYIFATAWLFNINYLKEVLGRISALCNPEGIFLGGPEFLGNNIEFLKSNPFITAVFKGEGEEMFEKFICSLLAKDGKWKDLKGFEWVEQGASNEKPEAEWTELETERTDPAAKDSYHSSKAVTVSKFSEVEYPEKSQLFSWNKSFVQLETSRGCFNSCRFCVSGIEKSGIQNLPVELLRSRLQNIVEHGIKQVRVLDRTFNGNPSRALELLDLFKEFAGNLNFHLEEHPALLFPVAENGEESAAENVKESAVGKLRKALAQVPEGLLHIEAGIQTLQQDVLDNCARKGSCAQAVKGLQFLIGCGKFEVHADLIAGLPEYSYPALVADTMEMMRIAPAEIQLESLKLLPGTHFRINANSLGIKFSPAPPYEVLETPHITYTELGKAMTLSKILDLWYNDAKWREPFREIFSSRQHLLLQLIEELLGTDYITQPLSLENKGLLLYRFCKRNIPEMAPLISLQWLHNGLSVKKEPAENFIKWEMDQGTNSNPLFVEGDPRYKYYYLTLGDVRHWFSFNKEIERIAPCGYLAEELTD